MASPEKIFASKKIIHQFHREDARRGQKHRGNASCRCGSIQGVCGRKWSSLHLQLRHGRLDNRKDGFAKKKIKHPNTIVLLFLLVHRTPWTPLQR